MQIQINDPRIGERSLSAEEWANEASTTFKLQDFIPGVPVEAFNLKDWYAGWRSKTNPLDHDWPSHIRFTAIDEFTALIPWEQLDQAAMQYAIDGASLSKGYPIRLYVPQGSSECLNVKSIVQIELLYEPELGDEASYGFKNVISVADMIMSKGE